MPEPRLIRSYLAVLAAELPAAVVEELADGLAETHDSYLRQGLAPDAAARAARGTRYRRAARTGAAGLIGVIVLDAGLLVGVPFAGASLTWVLAMAMAASAARLLFAARALRPALAH